MCDVRKCGECSRVARCCGNDGFNGTFTCDGRNGFASCRFGKRRNGDASGARDRTANVAARGHDRDAFDACKFGEHGLHQRGIGAERNVDVIQNQ